MKDLITVVVPVYMVENYLRECIDSVINQTYKELEIILVDDGSPDKCGEICDEYANKDSRIQVIHKRNGGLSDARNCGIALASGRYITFVDSDDYLAMDMIENLYNLLKKSKADICVCQPQKVYSDQRKDKSKSEVSDCVVDGERNCLKYYFLYNGIGSFAWGKLYKTSLFSDIRYPIKKYHEDEYTTYKLISISKRIYITACKQYFYRIRTDSIMHSSFSDKHLDVIEAAVLRKDYVEKYFPDLAYLARGSIVHATNMCVLRLVNSAYMPLGVIHQLQSNYRKYEKDFLRCKNSFFSKAFSIAAYCNLKFLIYILVKIKFKRDIF